MVCNGPCSPAVDDERAAVTGSATSPTTCSSEFWFLFPSSRSSAPACYLAVGSTSGRAFRCSSLPTTRHPLSHPSRTSSPGVIRGYATDVDMPDVLISVRGCFQYTLDEAVRIAASAFLVAQRATTTTTRFGFFVSRHAVNLELDETEDEDDECIPPPTLHMPCFPMVTEFALSFRGVELRMPRTGVFEKLTKLYIFGVQFTDGGDGINNAIIRQCPCHQDLELHRVEGIKMLFLLSESLLRLRLYKVMDLERLLVTAKNLREMEVTKCFVMMAIERTWIWLTLPKLEKLHWEDCCPDEIQRWSLPSQIWNLTIVELSRGYLNYCGGGQSHFTRILQAFKRTDILRLEIPIAPVSIIY
ncbi:hypothetical protein PR202_ga29653 [Eleusine coracana subsp. coracana]|uniref:Uncharacterized protein n=1 Tax=Eleusine coracana subsp. coracana TaxID=191504 RepID=A0AAV5DKJ4_ELECO|nr:hypothetical protein PR202_ga29653 [Eleusine coracana subsp. coracana]